jgi:hypothetical protein
MQVRVRVLAEWHRARIQTRFVIDVPTLTVAIGLCRVVTSDRVSTWSLRCCPCRCQRVALPGVPSYKVLPGARDDRAADVHSWVPVPWW